MLALGADVVALQEIRIGEDSLSSIRASLKQNGYNLYVGTLPNYKMQGHNKKSFILIKLSRVLPLLCDVTFRCKKSTLTLWVNGHEMDGCM